MHCVPGRLEDPVEEPEGDDPADELVGQEVVGSEDRRLRLSISRSNHEVVMYRLPPSVPPKATEVGLVVGSSTTPSRVPSAR
jgi:hypothetical protein